MGGSVLIAAESLQYEAVYEIAAVAFLAACVVALALAARRAREVFRIRVREGRVTQVRGRVGAETVSELADVLERARVEEATLRGVLEGGRTKLVADGVSPPIAQRLRNTFDAVTR